MINGMINELSIDDRVVTWCAADNTTDRVVEHVGDRTAHRLGAIALAPTITRAASSTRGVSAIPQLPIRATQTARPLSRTRPLILRNPHVPSSTAHCSRS